MRPFRAIVGAVVSDVGRDEVLLCAGLVALTSGLWPLCGWSALIAPGAVFTWMALPARAPFVQDVPVVESKSKGHG